MTIRRHMFSAIVALLLIAAGAMAGASYAVADTGSGADETIVIGQGKYVVDFDDPKSARKVINKALKRATKIDGTLTVVIPKGEYHLSSTLFIWSNTTLQLNAGAKLVSEHMGATLRGAHLDDSGGRCTDGASCTHGSYSQIHDITVQGAGLFDCNTSLPDTGWGTFGITLRHGRDITVRGVKMRHFSNHTLNLSGTKNVLVEDVSFENAKTYTGKKTETFWGENYSDGRQDTIEAVHLDFCNEDGEASAYPVDNTPVCNATVRGCTFTRVFAGVGTHHPNVHDGKEAPARDILVEDCTFSHLNSGNSGLAGIADKGAHWGNCVEFASARNVTVRGCTADNVESLADFARCKGVRIQSNKAARCRGGICVTERSSAPVIAGNTISGVVSASGKPASDTNALYFYDHVSATVSGNTISGAGRAGIRANGHCTIAVQANGGSPTKVSRCGTHGISVGASCTATIAGARISDCGENGIVANGAKSMAVKGAVVSRSGKYGIGAKKCTASIRSSTVAQSKRTGIYLAETKRGTLAKSNSVSASGGNGIELDACKDATVRDNKVVGSKRDGICASAPEGATCTATIAKNTSTSSRRSGKAFDFAIRENCASTVLAGNKFGKRCVYLDEQSDFRQSGNRPKSRITLSKVKVSGLVSKRYTGKARKQSVSVKTIGNFPLVKSKNFKVSYKNNVKASTGARKATIAVKGTGLYRFTAKRHFNILRASVGSAKVASVAARTYSGKAFQPKPKVRWRGKTLKRGRDYVVSWRDNANAGTAQVRIRGIGNFKDVKVREFTIKPRSLAGARITNAPDTTYTGAAITPEPLVRLGGKTLVGGVDYWVSYDNNVGPGTATVTIHGADNYTGFASTTFQIRERPNLAASI